MEPNKPTPPRKVFGTDAGLDYPAQLSLIERASSLAVTRLHSMVQTVTDPAEVAEIVRALASAQQMIRREMNSDGEGPEPSEEQLARAIKK